MNDDVRTDEGQQQLPEFQGWLRYAPEPPERGNNSYDVFISYRSSDRAWAMALYDALKLAGWEAFLDQYDLVAGTSLQTSLSEALEASSSGVILWSSRTKDSEWCQNERNAMHTLMNRHGSSFNYVFAKLDDEELPLFRQEDLYVDFEDCPEGPRGEKLLRLLCGIRGVKLAPEAVRMAQQVDQDAKETLVEINGAIEADNPAPLLEIGTSTRPGVLASPTPVLAAAQGLISMGKCEDAQAVLRQACEHFPRSIRAKQLEGLVLRRLERYQQAIDVLSQLKAAGHQDPETLGTLGAAWYGRFLESGKKRHLRTSREQYRTAFQADPSNYYTGINAASKSLFLGELEEAEKFVTRVCPLVEEAGDGEDFWAGCTLGEVYLLQRQLEAAAELYQKVIDKHPARVGDLDGTRKQAEKICAALGLSNADTEKVMAPFKLLDD